MFKFLRENVGAARVVNVGSKRVQVQKQIAEGGFACIFLARDVNTKETYALKRLLVTDKEEAKVVQYEVDLAKFLPPHPNIVRFFDAGMHSEAGTMEGFILMEYCEGESLLSKLNASIGGGLREDEILFIFQSIVEAVAHLHSQNPPIIHRDLKIENVLQDTRGVWKLCDFGSATTKTLLCSNTREVLLAEDEVFRYTTPSHRSPEMWDLHCGKVVDIRSDVWALGCMLFKLSFLQNAFEENKLAVINGNYQIPPTSRYSPQFHSLFSYIFVLDPDHRPTVYDLLEKIASMRGVSVSFTRPKPQPQKKISQPQAHPNQPQAPVNQPKSIWDLDDAVVSPTPQKPHTAPVAKSVTPQASTSNSGWGDDWVPDWGSSSSHAPAPVQAPAPSLSVPSRVSSSQSTVQVPVQTDVKGRGRRKHKVSHSVGGISTTAPDPAQQPTDPFNVFQNSTQAPSKPTDPSQPQFVSSSAGPGVFDSNFFSEPFGSTQNSGNQYGFSSSQQSPFQPPVTPPSPNPVPLKSPCISPSPSPLGNAHPTRGNLSVSGSEGPYGSGGMQQGGYAMLGNPTMMTPPRLSSPNLPYGGGAAYGNDAMGMVSSSAGPGMYRAGSTSPLHEINQVRMYQHQQYQQQQRPQTPQEACLTPSRPG